MLMLWSDTNTWLIHQKAYFVCFFGSITLIHALQTILQVTCCKSPNLPSRNVLIASGLLNVISFESCTRGGGRIDKGLTILSGHWSSAWLLVPTCLALISNPTSHKSASELLKIIKMNLGVLTVLYEIDWPGGMGYCWRRFTVSTFCAILCRHSCSRHFFLVQTRDLDFGVMISSKLLQARIAFCDWRRRKNRRWRWSWGICFLYWWRKTWTALRFGWINGIEHKIKKISFQHVEWLR